MAEQTKVFNVYPRRNSRTYPSFPLQLEKNHQTSRLLKDEARFPALRAEQFLVPNQTGKEP